MTRFVYNKDLHMLYPEPTDRELKLYECIAKCPFCGNTEIEDLRAARFYPPFSCGRSSVNSRCNNLFTLEEIRDALPQ